MSKQQMTTIRNSKASVRTMPIVEVKVVTWNKESHGLFDYENNYYDMKKFSILNSVVISRKRGDIQVSDKDKPLENQDLGDTDPEYLLSIGKGQRSETNYSIEVPGDFPNGHLAPKPTYLIVRSLKCKDGRSQRGFSLTPGNVIKLGRMEYRVTEIQTGHDETTIRKIENYSMLPSDNLFDADTQIETESEHEKVCKYCLLDTVSEDPLENKMLYPCKCSGSSAGVHFICLKNWIQYKILAKNNQNVATYQWKKLECEICLEPFPRKVRFKSIVNELINVERPPCPYIIFEKLNQDQKSYTYVLIIPDENDVVKIGRGHQCDMRVSDISVSRIHAHIKFQNNEFLIFDNDSKFGTLILLNENYKVKFDKAAVQVGRTVFTFVLKNQVVDNQQVTK